MTRSYASARRARTLPTATRCARDPSIHRVSFTCFRLIAIDDPEPGEGPFAPIELMRSSNTMGVFVFEAARPWG